MAMQDRSARPDRSAAAQNIGTSMTVSNTGGFSVQSTENPPVFARRRIENDYDRAYY